VTKATRGTPAGRRTSLLVRMGNAARDAGVVPRRIHLVVAIDRLLDGPALDDVLEREIGPIVAAQGWAADSVPVTARQAGLSVHRALYHWRLFGLLDEVRAKWEGGRPTGPSSTALNAVGRAAAIAFLHARATAPRTDLRA